ncbi:MAG: hypothetical protein ABL956_13095 [Hyphomonadaceae bacterium]
MLSMFSREVRACRRALSEIEYKYDDVRSLGVGNRVRSKLMRESANVVQSVRHDGKPAHGIVWLLISNIVDLELVCGWNHVYRNVLSMRGRSYLALWDTAAEQMSKFGIHTIADEIEEKQYIRERIAEAG